MTGFRDSDHFKAWVAFLRSHRAVMDVLHDELEGELGLPLSWYDVLVQLSIAPHKRLRMRQLADSVMLSRSGLTRLIDRMEAEGLIERVQCESDRRGYFAVLTPRGAERLRQAWPVHRRGIREHFAGRLSDTEARALARALGKIADGALAVRSSRARSGSR